MTVSPIRVSVHTKQAKSQGQCCGTITIFYGSGSGSDFRQVTVPVQTSDKLRFRFRFRLYI
jgi:hypothetical protein